MRTKTGKLSALAADVHKMMLLHSKCVDRKKYKGGKSRQKEGVEELEK
jgi:hypothetical protein